MTPTVLLLSLNLRLGDDPALSAAAREGPVVPLYVLDAANDGPWPIGGASRWWLHHSLNALGQALETRGSKLVLRRGDTMAVVRAIARETGARTVRTTRAYEPAAAAAQARLKSALESDGIVVRRHGGRLLFEPEAMRTKEGGPFKVFTAFWRAVMQLDPPDQPHEVPKLAPPEVWPRSERLADWGLTPTRPDWAAGFAVEWTPGETGAKARIDALIEGPLAAYPELRNRPDLEGTSRLSPHLHFGEVSPRFVWHRIMAAVDADPRLRAGAGSFLRELVWREFNHHLIHYWPDLPEVAFRPDFAAFPWRNDPASLRAWQQGATGYPIVDAGMRELWTTGWMHNRVRMIVASFLIKDLLIPWQEGERWFWDTLLDADLANNAANWQWVAGSGADAAPYFRIFNPVSQGRKFDSEGAYVRRWVPELARLPDQLIHAPFEASAIELAAAGVALGKTYPLPIVDHKAARDRALAAFALVKEGRKL